MLTREQVYTLLELRECGNEVSTLLKIRQREKNMFSALPAELICHISDMGQDPGSEIAEALRLAVDGEEKALNELIAMLNKNPRLLLQAGNVITRGGQEVVRVTLYEFFLGAGDPDAAKLIEPYFSQFKGGEEQKEKQLERHKPHIEALAKQLESKEPTYDLRSLFDIIKQSSTADITAARNKDMTHQSDLCDALIKFREAVKPEKIAVGMHYKHYTTLMQAFDLLLDEWKTLSNNFTNYDKCDLVWKQIIGYLQRGLPAIDRFAFSRAFKDKLRSLEFKNGSGSFPDTSNGDSGVAGPGVDSAIFGGGDLTCAWCGVRWKLHVEQKTSDLQNLCSHGLEKKQRPGA